MPKTNEIIKRINLTKIKDYDALMIRSQTKVTKKILEAVNVDPTARTKDLSEEDLSKIIPARAVYYIGVTSTTIGEYESATAKLVEKEKMPETVGENDVYVYGNYEYRYNKYYNGSTWKTNTNETRNGSVFV